MGDDAESRRQSMPNPLQQVSAERSPLSISASRLTLLLLLLLLTQSCRWDNREPREEDVRRIRQLEIALAESEELVRTAEERMQQLRKELLLREDNYNKHFKNGGAGEKVLNVAGAMNAESDVMSWMGVNKGRKGSATTAASKQPQAATAQRAGSGSGGLQPLGNTGGSTRNS